MLSTKFQQALDQPCDKQCQQAQTLCADIILPLSFCGCPSIIIAPRSRFLPNDNLKYSFHTTNQQITLPRARPTQNDTMDPLESMSGGPVPKNFDAENAENNEDVSLPRDEPKQIVPMFR